MKQAVLLALLLQIVAMTEVSAQNAVEQELLSASLPEARARLSDRPATRRTNDTFKIGMLTCLTGDCAEAGTNSKNGAQLAVEELNQSGGVLGRQISLSVEDTREATSGGQALSAWKVLRTDPSIQYFVGPTWTTGGLTLLPAIRNDKSIVITSPSLGVADFNEAADHIFNIWPHDSIGTQALAKFAIDNGLKRAAVFSNTGQWESTQASHFQKEFIRLGGEITIVEEPLSELKDLRVEALRIKASNPDVVFMSNYTQMGVAAKALEQLQFKGRKLAILMDDTQIAVAAGALEGTVYAIYPESDASFQEKYFTRFNRTPGIAADTGYDTVYLYARAIELAQSFDPAKVKQIIPEIKFAGASGEIVFDGNRGVVKTPVLWTVKNGKRAPR